MEYEKNISLAILGVVALIAVVGSILYFSEPTSVGDTIMPSKKLLVTPPNVHPLNFRPFNQPAYVTQPTQNVVLTGGALTAGAGKKGTCSCSGTVRQTYNCQNKETKIKRNCDTGAVDVPSSDLPGNRACSSCQSACVQYLGQKIVTSSTCPINDMECTSQKATVVSATGTCK